VFGTQRVRGWYSLELIGLREVLGLLNLYANTIKEGMSFCNIYTTVWATQARQVEG